MLYVPVDTVIELDNAAGQMVCFGAPCTRQYEFAHIPFAQVDVRIRREDKAGGAGQEAPGVGPM